MAAETSYESAARRVFEHHGVEVPVSAVRRITMTTAQRAKILLEEKRPVVKDQISCQLVLEMDGVMVPVVEYERSKDRRKTKTLCWKEMKVGAVQDPERTRVSYACSFESADSLGDKMGILVGELGGESIPPLHGVGDGAVWIREQGERIGGCQYDHLIDFYHFCEYLHEAFSDHAHQDRMVQHCKNEAKAGDLSKVLRRLRREQKKHPQHEGVRNCLRYIKNRPGQFAYSKAMAKDLPIGSGLIESTNRSLVQKRLKLPGSWWLQENAELLAQLRALRANDCWEELWQQAA